MKKPKQLQVSLLRGVVCVYACVCDSDLLMVCSCEPHQEVLDITRQLLAELGQHNDCEIEEKKSKLEQLKTVLEM